MRKINFQTLSLLIIVFCFSHSLKAQIDISGLYNTSGYFFHPTISRDLLQSKSISKISDNRYSAQLGDVNLYFEFSLDSTNHLIDWACDGLGIDEPSGFMTSDNPGGFVYTASLQPGDSAWVHSIYDNTYDPITHALYIHCGYSTTPGDTGQSSYSRQVYEKWVLDHPAVVVSSFTPDTATSGTRVTIKGKYFSDFYDVSFGGQPADTSWAVSDTEAIAIVGAGATGDVKLMTYSGSSYLPGFIYVPPVVTDTGWISLGNAGFSEGTAKNINIAIDNSDNPFVVFSDSVNGYKARVMKLGKSNIWVNAGDFVSDGPCSSTNISIDDNNKVYVAYVDSTNNNNITVKKLVGSVWETVGNPGFAPALNIHAYKVSIAIDGNGRPYVVSGVQDITTPNYRLSVYKFNGQQWIQLGNSDIGLNSLNGCGIVAINKKTNVPYIVTDDITGLDIIGYPQLTVEAFENGSWITVGNKQFTSGTRGVYVPTIIIDSSGTPIVAVQEDNGREKLSVYKFNGYSWISDGPRFFSEGHAYNPSLAVDRNNMPVVLFLDAYYNFQGTVMRYNQSEYNWDLVGARGFTPSNHITQNALVINRNNIPYVAFDDKTKGNRVTVMRYQFVLPVSLINFSAGLQKQDVLVNWQTATEINTSFFNVQRSVDGLHFINIGKIAASGNSHIVHDYNFIDSNVASLNSKTIFYRLQTVDKDNHSTYSNIVAIRINLSNASITLWPNPVKDVLAVKINNYAGDADISVYNTTGKKIKQQAANINNESIITISVNDLESGIYFVSVKLKNDFIKEKFIKR